MGFNCIGKGGKMMAILVQISDELIMKMTGKRKGLKERI